MNERLSPRLGCATLLLATACQGPAPLAATAPEAGAVAAGSGTASAGHDGARREVLANMDLSVDPCQDFFAHACGGWLQNTEIPADQSRWGRFNELREANRLLLRDLLDGKDPSVPQKALTVYDACMDEPAIEKAGLEPLSPTLESIARVKDAASLMDVVGRLHRHGVSAMFRIGSGNDYKDPNLDIAHVYQSGLGLPDREVYLKDDERSKGLREAYVAHVTRMLELTEEKPEVARARAEAILAFETRLARASTPRDELRNPEARYHKIDREGLQKTARKIPWSAYFESVGHPGITHINVATPEFFKALSSEVDAARKDKFRTLRAYLEWHTIHEAAEELTQPLQQEHFAFYGKVLGGAEEMPPRWKHCVELTDRLLGEELGQAFVAKAFAGDSKTIAVKMIEAIEAAFEKGLPTLAWMDDATRARALEKMEAVSNEKIGYPDEWRDYGKVVVDGTHFTNVENAVAFEFDREMSNVGKPVRKEDWGMSPPTVNAYYSATNNEMVFPAGILQPPFFHAQWPMAMNFGGIGMVMGHELTHGFDDQGRKFDATGKFHEWWDPSVSARFEEEAACVEKLYSGFEVQPGVPLNGKLTLGENIADLGGIKETYRAYRDYVAANGEEPRFMEELSNDQLLFVAYSQVWCGKERPEAERMLVLTDSHSRPRFRVVGPLSQLPEFWAAFSCEPGTPMHPTETCEVW